MQYFDANFRQGFFENQLHQNFFRFNHCNRSYSEIFLTGGGFFGFTVGTEGNKGRLAEESIWCEIDCTLRVVCGSHV